MCGRYVMARAVGDLVADFGAELEEEFQLQPSWNIAPTTDVPILLERLVDGEKHRQLHVARWGLIPGWAKDPGIGVKMFNARSETVLEKPSFRAAIKSRRCAVPADGYYEWKKGEGKTKQPYYVHPATGSGIVFAGLYEWWKDPAKEDGAPDRWVLSTSIITTAAPSPDSQDPVLAELGALHDRLPVPLSKEALGDWLDPEAKDIPGLVELIRAQANEVATTWTLDAVGSAVGNVRNNSAELITPEEALF
ncbi:SOS response-associated peptidase [Pseudarthrobacter sp. J1738]|uniref:SOS response-associated peptidase n=1 Tax=unclassified Pseudarthrobacter TaxID=2647000 RepID=UPI003D2E1206